MVFSPRNVNVPIPYEQLAVTSFFMVSYIGEVPLTDGRKFVYRESMKSRFCLRVFSSILNFGFVFLLIKQLSLTSIGAFVFISFKIPLIKKRFFQYMWNR